MRPIAIALLLIAPVIHAAPVTSPCPTMTPNNTFISFTNAAGSCSPSQPACGINDTITFAASTFGYSFTCAVHSFNWDFGDGSSPATTPLVTHVYTSPGSYTVTLTIQSPIEVFALQTPIFIAVVDPLPPAPISFKAERSSGLDFTFTPAIPIPFLRLVWDFGDGSGTLTTSESTPVSHHYASAGTYTVTLRADTSSGSTATTAQIAAVTRQRAARH